MRPAYLVAVLAVVLVLGALLLFVPAGEPPRHEPAPPRPGLTLPVREAGALADEDQRDQILDEVEDEEAKEYGKAEAARRRGYREQLLDQRPSPGD
ncbi:MAG: hypothetical protein AAF211_26115 [Myxococcota bacterium]